MDIKVMGTGCPKCKALAQVVTQAVTELGINAEVKKVTDLKEIMAMGVMMTPALAVNGVVKVTGRVPGVVEIKTLLQ